MEWFYVTTLSDQNLILGLPWLEKYNLIINWKEKTLGFWSSPEELAKMFIRSLDNVRSRGPWSHVMVYNVTYRTGAHRSTIWTIRILSAGQLHIRRYSPAQQMEHKYRTNLEESTLPTAYRPWKKVFEQKASEQFPDWHPWDHGIELKDGFVPKRSKPYTLGPGDQKLLDAWVKEQLKKDYIRQSESPQVSGFFFVQKKDAKKKCPCQGYQYLNRWTKPNAYPIPLISDLMLKLKGSWYFMKLDIQWGYNNVRLKQGDKFLSHALTPTEWNWQIYDQELFAIIYALDKWKHLLLGAEHTLTIHCNHKSLTYYKSPQHLTLCQAWWWNNLSWYNFNLVHIPGMKLIQAEVLSCWLDHMQGQEEDELVTMLLTDLFLNLISIDLCNHIAKLTETDAYAATIYSCIKRKAPPLWTALTDWTLDNGLILFKNKVYVPEDLDLCWSIIAETHELPVARHPGHFKTLQLLKEWFYWPCMVTMMNNFVEGCTTCQQMKLNTHPTTVPLMPIISHATWPFQQVMMDFITSLPISNSFDSIFIVVNQGLSKGVILCPCNKTINADETMKLYIDNIFIQSGLPDIIISDRGPQFASKVFNGIFEAIGVKHKMSTVFHPQTDGQTER